MRYSIVIPFKNEEENVEPLLHEIGPVMQAMGQPFEVIAIDDGSTDRTLACLKGLKHKYPWLRILKFARNYGQSGAFDAGFKAARGEFIVTLDGDRQNDPADIPKLIALAHEGGVDLICGRRAKRQDSLSKKLTSKLGNFVRSRLCEDGVRDTGCSLKLYRKACFDKVKLYHGMHRFLPALFLIEGFTVKEVPVHHRQRVAGKTKYNLFNRSLNTIADLLAVWWMKRRRLVWQIEEES